MSSRALWRMSSRTPGSLNTTMATGRCSSATRCSRRWARAARPTWASCAACCARPRSSCCRVVGEVGSAEAEVAEEARSRIALLTIRWRCGGLRRHEQAAWTTCGGSCLSSTRAPSRESRRRWLPHGRATLPAHSTACSARQRSANGARRGASGSNCHRRALNWRCASPSCALPSCLLAACGHAPRSRWPSRTKAASSSGPRPSSWRYRMMAHSALSSLQATGSQNGPRVSSRCLLVKAGASKARIGASCSHRRERMVYGRLHPPRGRRAQRRRCGLNGGRRRQWSLMLTKATS
mmetsp:Transcript_50035/g.115476  ORF Transcript_50035/g.115476 Transcript_50035/m.115476 type:complete len:294 (+) Transcript_50035:521-1402(+)